jgi:uncharacterized LabA/DUF88 family protein
MSEKAAVFIDGGYLDKVLQDLGIARVNLQRLSDKIVGRNLRLRSYYYHCSVYQSNPPTLEEKDRFQKKERFFNALRRLTAFEVRLGYLVFKGKDHLGNPIFQQKGVDIHMAVDLMRLSLQNKIDIAYLIAGDGDLLPLVVSAKDAGVFVNLYYGNGPTSNYSQQLWDACDARKLMDHELLKDCLLPGTISEE